MKKLLFLFLLNYFNTANALTIHWVGDSITCDATTNSHPNLDAALFASILNSDDDEIRLTARGDYTGAGDSNYTFTDINPSTTGSLTIKGGYNDCQSIQSGRTVVGNHTGTVFTIQTTSQPISSVKLESLEIKGSDLGVAVIGGAEVTLANTVVQNHKQGVKVSSGGYLDILQDSTIQLNDDFSNTDSQGGGLYCTGEGSVVLVKGRFFANRADEGGNLFVNDRCFVELVAGSEIAGLNNRSVPEANFGAAMAVSNFGELLSSGNSTLIRIKDHNSGLFGGGVYVVSNGRATLFNTYISNNYADTFGSAVYVSLNGAFVMDRVGPCPFLISCSRITQNDFARDVVVNRWGTIDISRTIIDQNTLIGNEFQNGVIHSQSPNSIIRLDHVGIYGNETNTAMTVTQGQIEVSHATIARNTFGAFQPSSIEVYDGTIDIENSILVDSIGAVFNETNGSIQGKCNLVDLPGQMPNEIYFIGTAVFNDNFGDLRQQAQSDSVDACMQDTFAWSNDTDIEFQISPVDESTNPEGVPGEVGGFYDAGFDEAYINILDDDLIFANGFE